LFLFIGKLSNWFKSHYGIQIFHEALQQAFPNHNVDCLLLCTTEDCQYNQYAHTDNNKWACLFHEDLHKHVCQNNDGHATCRKDKNTTPVTRDMCPFSVFLAVENFTSLIVGNGVDYKESKLLSPRLRQIKKNNALFITGSTPHAGVKFPKQLSRRSGPQRSKSGPKVHYRVFFDGSPKCHFCPDSISPQWKLKAQIDDSSL